MCMFNMLTIKQLVTLTGEPCLQVLSETLGCAVTVPKYMDVHLPRMLSRCPVPAISEEAVVTRTQYTRKQGLQMLEGEKHSH